MRRVFRMPEDLANQIAAGEVVERPASVVKELLENSLDAGAASLEVEVRGGGSALLRVTDDGGGMDREDALMALERHATSKISTADDLFSVQTMGFRGEALPSIASVSEFLLRTRVASSPGGTEAVVRGGKLVAVRVADLYGAEEGAQLFALAPRESGGLRISGLVSRPGVTRADRARQFFFVNGRESERHGFDHAIEMRCFGRCRAEKFAARRHIEEERFHLDRGTGGASRIPHRHELATAHHGFRSAR